MTTALRPCRFSFADDTAFSGYAEGTTWNGFDNVSVTPAVRDQIAAWAAREGDEDTALDIADLPVEEGLVSLAGGWATVIDHRLDLATREFPDFDDWATCERLLDMGWEDVSYGNDACPSFCRGDVTIYVDYVEAERREFYPEAVTRFGAHWGAVHYVAETEGDYLDAETLEDLFAKIAEALPGKLAALAKALRPQCHNWAVAICEACDQFAVSDDADVEGKPIDEALLMALGAQVWDVLKAEPA